MGFTELKNHIGTVVSACQVGDPQEVATHGVEAVAGMLAGVSMNWAQEMILTFAHGERVTVLAGDVVEVGATSYTLT